MNMNRCELLEKLFTFGLVFKFVSVFFISSKKCVFSIVYDVCKKFPAPRCRGENHLFSLKI